ncbi:hypothetical protein OS493_033617 [Desmophyllum pertusum]|uniref:Uncharacterized protein n=1 Tax=Desmophyllum pertusum TaxID=174260 RepID=A0A9W9YJ69_9CNID|nr:hypothetical protein OS493_033617 [Desmophyllum pertusum]
MKSLFALAFLLCISVGYGLKCYKCASTKGVKTVGVSFEGYEKGCTTAALCDKAAEAMKSKCKDQAKCTLDCCSGDLCNAAALQMVSAVVLITCALVALLY